MSVGIEGIVEITPAMLGWSFVFFLWPSERIQEITPALLGWFLVYLLWLSVLKEYKRSLQHCLDDFLYIFYDCQYRRNTRDHPSIAWMISCIYFMTVSIEGIQEITQQCWDDLLYSSYDRLYKKNRRGHTSIAGIIFRIHSMPIYVYCSNQTAVCLGYHQSLINIKRKQNIINPQIPHNTVATCQWRWPVFGINMK